MVVAGGGVQDELGAVGDLGAAGQGGGVVGVGGGVPGHDGDVPRGTAGVDAGAGAVGDFAEDGGDALVGEAEAEPDQMTVQEAGKDARQLAGVGAAVFGGGQDDAVGAAVQAVEIGRAS